MGERNAIYFGNHLNLFFSACTCVVAVASASSESLQRSQLRADHSKLIAEGSVQD